MVEDHDARQCHNDSECRRENQAGDGNCALSEDCIAEHFHRCRYGIDHQDRLHDAVAELGERVHNGRRIHPQLYSERDEDGQVTVFRGQTGDDDAEAEPHDAEMHQHQRNREPCPPVRSDRAGDDIVREEQEDKDHLHRQLDRGREHV